MAGRMRRGGIVHRLLSISTVGPPIPSCNAAVTHPRSPLSASLLDGIFSAARVRRASLEADLTRAKREDAPQRSLSDGIFSTGHVRRASHEADLTRASEDVPAFHEPMSVSTRGSCAARLK